MRQIRFNKSNKPEFFADLKEQVALYFKEKGLKKNANTSMVVKSIFFLLMLFGLYALIVTETFSTPINLVLVILLGLTQTFIGFNVSHDAIHGSYSSNTGINKILSYTYDIMGLNSYIWRTTHNTVHHTYTNIPGHDEDLEIAPGLIRLSPTEKRRPFMRFQHIYAFFLYLFTSLSWVFRKDYKKMFQAKIGEVPSTNHPIKEFVILFASKIFYVIMFMALPLMVMDITIGEFFIGFFAMHFFEGLMGAFVFQLAHVVEEASFTEPDENWHLEESWALTQMNGTANFSVNSSLATFFFGGLNYQIEHHLFPSICHIHYPEISKLVQKIAAKHQVRYNVNRTFTGAIFSHYKMLKKFGAA